MDKKNLINKWNKLVDNVVYHLLKLYNYNKSLRHWPLIVFVILYIFSGIDLLPEMFIKRWYAYLDDAFFTILLFVYFYCVCRGVVHNDSRINSQVDSEKNIYSNIVRNSGKRNSDNNSQESLSCINEFSDNFVGTDVCNNDDFKRDETINGEELFESIRKVESDEYIDYSDDYARDFCESEKYNPCKKQREKQKFFCKKKHEEFTQDGDDIMW